MRWLKEQGFEVHYASAGEEEVLDSDKHFTIPFSRNPLKFGNIRAYRQLKQIIDTEKYDIIHTHTPVGSVITRLAAKAARKNGTRVIYTAHGFHFFKGAPLLNWLVYYPVEKWMSQYTDALVTINQEDFELARKSFFAKETFKINGVGVDLSRFKPASKREKKELRKEYDYDKDDFILICVAELNKNKNQSFLLTQLNDLREEMPNAKLILCGTGDLLDDYKKKLEMLGLTNIVKLMGYRHDIDKLLQMSDLCVASSRREGLGINLIEAMAVGLPIIASNNRGHREVVEHEVNGYLYPLADAEGFNKSVLSIYTQQGLAKRASEKSTLRAQDFSLQKAIDSMSVIYKLSEKSDG